MPDRHPPSQISLGQGIYRQCHCGPKTLDEHIQHLQLLFQLFSSVGISINPTKAFLGYPSIRILGQHVDSLGLSTDAEKLEAISRLQFPEMLKQLEIYLGLTGYLRQYVPFYAAVSAPLH